MTDEQLDAVIDAMAPALGLTIQDEWRDAVRQNLGVTLRLASVVLEIVTPDDLDPAPVFRP